MPTKLMVDHETIIMQVDVLDGKFTEFGDSHFDVENDLKNVS